MGGFMVALWSIRFFLFKLHESPKYLMGCGRDEDAVAVIHRVAKYNGMASSLTLEHLSRVGGLSNEETKVPDTTTKGAIARNLAKFDGAHVKSLFATKKLAYSTTMLMILWASLHEEPISVMDLCTSHIATFVLLSRFGTIPL
ncbi:hypothetical protein H0H92_008253 [Tricholoma furcatifolium]|nr:hypothetical protein H0H92_008253 [Tricholoma furcatifolium]